MPREEFERFCNYGYEDAVSDRYQPPEDEDQNYAYRQGWNVGNLLVQSIESDEKNAKHIAVAQG